MKTVFRFLRRILSIPLAALAGMLIGGQLRFILTGEETQVIQFKFKTKDGRTMTNTPVATKFYPGMMGALIGKPRWFFAFVGGILAGALVPDQFERVWLEKVIQPYIVDRLPSDSG